MPDNITQMALPREPTAQEDDKQEKKRNKRKRKEKKAKRRKHKISKVDVEEKIPKVKYLKNESEEGRQLRLQRMRELQTKRLLRETPEERAVRLAKMRENFAFRIRNQNFEERQMRLQKLREFQYLRLLNETPEQRQIRLAKMRDNFKKRYAEKHSHRTKDPLLSSQQSDEFRKDHIESMNVVDIYLQDYISKASHIAAMQIKRGTEKYHETNGQNVNINTYSNEDKRVLATELGPPHSIVCPTTVAPNLLMRIKTEPCGVAENCSSNQIYGETEPTPGMTTVKQEPVEYYEQP